MLAKKKLKMGLTTDAPLYQKKMVNSSTRNIVLIKKNNLWGGEAHASLLKRIPYTGGRNNNGHKTNRQHSGALNPRKYRIIDFLRTGKDSLKGVVERIEYDPGRTCFIALVRYDDLPHNNKYSYILATEKMKAGQKIIAGKYDEKGKPIDIIEGNSLDLSDIPIGTAIHNIPIQKGKKGVFVKSAGTFAVLVAKENGYAKIKLPSGTLIKISLNNRVTIGKLCNALHKNQQYGKAGYMIAYKKSMSRTSAGKKNPVDHKMGGRSKGSNKQGCNFKGNSIHFVKTANPKGRPYIILNKREKKK